MRLRYSMGLCLRKSTYASICVLLSVCQGCGIYSPRGAVSLAGVETISIQQFYNGTSLGPPELGDVFSRDIRDYFERNASYTLVSEGGDLQIEGLIEDYTLKPVAVTSSGSEDGIDYGALTRMTITVSVTYINTKDDANNFENKRFSFFRDFDQQAVDFLTEEETLIAEIFEQIVIDIFNSTLAAW